LREENLNLLNNMAYTEKRLAELKGWMENVIEHDVERQYIKSFLKESIQQAVAEERNQAYTSLVEGIEVALKRRFVTQPQEYKDSDANVWREGYNRALNDILENVVKPLYGKK